ncbi:MAG: cysteine synthase A [Candidatus Wallbacteria bacterium]
MNLSAPVLARIGNTPIVRIFSSLTQNVNIYAKIESSNPGFSVKDRVAYAMIVAGVEKGLIKPDTTVIEPTSGNTGIGLALVCAALKFKIKLVMPETMSIERRKILKHLGAEIILSDGAKGMKGAVETAESICNGDSEKYFMPQQFNNPANPEVHRKTTAVEFLSFMNQYSIKPDALVFGVGTGGTLTGVSEVIKKFYPGVRTFAVEPASSPVLSGGQPGPHKIQGIGAGFIPGVLNTKIIDEIMKITNEEAFEYCRKLSANEGIMAGISSGAAACAAFKIAQNAACDDRRIYNIFTLFPDATERYLSMFEN